MTIDPECFENAKRSTIVKLVKCRESHFMKNQVDFTENVLKMDPGCEVGKRILNLKNYAEMKAVQKKFSDHFLNSKNLNMVVMLPKTHAMKMKMVKSFLSHGIKLFS